MEIKVETDHICKYGFVDACLLGFMKANPRVSKKEMSDALGLSETALRDHIKAINTAIKIRRTTRPHEGRGRREILYEIK